MPCWHSQPCHFAAVAGSHIDNDTENDTENDIENDIDNDIDRAAMTAAPKPVVLRQTRQRTAVAELLDGLEEFKSAQELHLMLRRSGEQIGLTTVYRSLQSLADASEIDLLVSDDGETRYRKCSTTHHHHLVCRDCGSTVEIAGPAVESWADTLAAEHGFTEVSHTLEIFGRCRRCSHPRGGAGLGTAPP